jgi:hypothetical protein
MHYGEFLIQLERALRETVISCFPRTWDENHISYRIMEELPRRFSTTEIQGLARPFATKWDAFKLRGPLEQAHGDIAVLVQFRSWEGETLEGVGFLEAKRRDVGAETYPAIDFSQLQRIRAKSPHTQVLLYDYNQISEFGDNLRLTPFAVPYWPNELGAPFTHTASVQISTVIQLRKRSPSLYKYAFPLSLQLCARFLRGFDLDYRASVVRRVKGFASAPTDTPYFLLVVGVSTGFDKAPGNGPPVNTNIYEHVRG